MSENMKEIIKRSYLIANGILPNPKPINKTKLQMISELLIDDSQFDKMTDDDFILFLSDFYSKVKEILIEN